MGERTVRFSDLSGRQFEAGDEPVRLVVLEHPELPGEPVEIEGLASEVTPALDAALNVAVVELHMPGEGRPRRVVIEADDFDALATDAPMAALLKNAAPIKQTKRTTSARTDYANLEHAGTPHRGKVTAEEAAIVREHLDAVNERLQKAGLRTIDPTDPEHASRYGFPAPSA